MSLGAGGKGRRGGKFEDVESRRKEYFREEDKSNPMLQ
jgi:hypothetical protein